MALAAAVPLGTNRAVQREVQHRDNKPKASPWLRGRVMPVKPIWFWPPLTLIREAFRLPVGGLSRRQGKTFPTASSRCTLGTSFWSDSGGHRVRNRFHAGLRLASGRWCIRPGEIVAAAPLQTCSRWDRLLNLKRSKIPAGTAHPAASGRWPMRADRFSRRSSGLDQPHHRVGPGWAVSRSSNGGRRTREGNRGRQVLAPNTPLVRNLYEQDGSGLHAHVPKVNFLSSPENHTAGPAITHHGQDQSESEIWRDDRGPRKSCR